MVNNTNYFATDTTPIKVISNISASVGLTLIDEPVIQLEHRLNSNSSNAASLFLVPVMPMIPSLEISF